MRLDEFYNPQKDRSARRDFDDTRKTKLTLETLNKLMYTIITSFNIYLTLLILYTL